MPFPGKSRAEMSRPLGDHAVAPARDEILPDWPSELFENGLPGCHGFSDRQRRWRC